MKICGCSSLEEFRNVPAEKLFEVWQTSKKDIKGGRMASFPVKDGCFITGGSPKNINYMIGSTSEDMMPPFLYAMGRNWGVKNPVKTYAWFFDRRLPGDETAHGTAATCGTGSVPLKMAGGRGKLRTASCLRSWSATFAIL